MTTLIPKFDLKDGNTTPTGAINRPINEKLADFISVKDFGATGDGTTDDTVAIQAAINYAKATTGIKSIIFPTATYVISSAINIAGSFDYGILIDGQNSNIISNSATQTFYISATDGSTTAPASRLKLVLQNFVIRNNGIANAKGVYLYNVANVNLKNISIWNYEYGIYGEGCLISQFDNISVQNGTNGIHFIATGTFSPNDNHWTNCQITSNTTAIYFSDFPSSTCTFTGCEIEANNAGGSSTDGVKVIDFENAGNVTFTGCHLESMPGQYVLYYSSSGARYLNLIGCDVFPGDSCGTVVYMDSGQLSVIGSRITSNTAQQIYMNTGARGFIDCSFFGIIYGDTSNTVQVYLGLNNIPRITNTNGFFYLTRLAGYGIEPGVDNTMTLGSGSFRWSTVYAATGTINTSDANQKTDIVDISDVEKRVAVKLKSSMKRFKFKDGKRYHFGTIAQDVKFAFESEGLVAEEYGVFCSDVLEDGTVQLGVRYDELFAFIISAL